jgi:hypothetical protein
MRAAAPSGSEPGVSSAGAWVVFRKDGMREGRVDKGDAMPHFIGGSSVSSKLAKLHE